MSATKIGIVIQARMGSTRLPDKMCKEFYLQKSLAEIVFQKFANSSLKSIVATTVNHKDVLIAGIAKKKGLAIYKGSELNILN